MFYIVQSVLLTIVLPLAATIVDAAATGRAWYEAALAWFVFFGGVRLFTAGLSQVIRPQFTVNTILGEQHPNPGADHLAQELGFANLGLGLLGLLAPWMGWSVPAALAIGVFLFAAGIRHVAKRGKQTREWIATVTDLVFATALLVLFVIGLYAQLLGENG